MYVCAEKMPEIALSEMIFACDAGRRKVLREIPVLSLYRLTPCVTDAQPNAMLLTTFNHALPNIFPHNNFFVLVFFFGAQQPK